MSGELTEGARSHLANAVQVLAMGSLTNEVTSAVHRLRLAMEKLDSAIAVVRPLREKYEDPEYEQLMELLS